MHLTQPTPELPVPDVRAAQAYYRDVLGFDVGWYNEAGRIGSVSRDDCALFFRESDAPPNPATFWLFVADVDAAFAAFDAGGADTDGPPQDMPWGLRQFTLRDHLGNRFLVFRD